MLEEIAEQEKVSKEAVKKAKISQDQEYYS